MKKSLEERKRLSYIALNDEKASPREFISNVRSLRYSELAISQKKEEIQKMKEFIKMKEDKLKYNMKKFESDKNFFSSYIQEVKTKEENANKKIEDIEQKIKIISDMNGNLQNEISSMRMLMERNLDNLKKLKSQQEFIFSLCPPNLVKKFKEDRIVKLKSRGISDPTIFNAILTSGEQGITEDSKSKVIEHSKEKEYFNDLHELGFTEVDSDDDFPVLFSNKNEIIEIINQYEERSLKNIITLEENNKLYDTNKQEYNEKINKKMREKLEQQKKLDEIDDCYKFKKTEYEKLEQTLSMQKSMENIDLFSNPQTIFEEIESLCTFCAETNPNLTDPVDELRDIEERIQKMILCVEYRGLVKPDLLEKDKDKIKFERKKQIIDANQKREEEKFRKNKEEIEKRDKKQVFRIMGKDNVFKSLPKIRKIVLKEEKKINTEALEYEKYFGEG